MSHECDSILHFQNITADDNNLDVMLSHENDTYIEQDDTDMEKQINSTLLFPTVGFFIIDVSFDSWHVNVIPFYVFRALRMTIIKMPFFPLRSILAIAQKTLTTRTTSTILRTTPTQTRYVFLLLTSLLIHGTLMLFHFTFFRPHRPFH